MTKNRSLYIDIFRAIAVCVVLNSHYEGVYPIELAIGGELGLSIFFILSGYLTASSSNVGHFLPWIGTRAVRLYLPLYIYTAIRIAAGKITIISAEGFFRIFIYPTEMWFASYMLLLYVLAYVVKRLCDNGCRKAPKYGMVVSLFVFFAVYFFRSNFRYYYVLGTYDPLGKIWWIVCLFIGFLLQSRVTIMGKNHSRIIFAGLTVSLLIYGIMKIAIKRKLLLDIQFLTVFACTNAAVLLFVILHNNESKLSNITPPKKFLMAILTLLSGASLEIYFVQFWIIEAFRNMVFPLNWLLITSLTIAGGNLLHYVSDRASKLIVRK